jgi:hypothetical protein
VNYSETYAANLKKIAELEERVQSAAVEWMRRCWELGLHFRITEAYRSPTQQFLYWLKGRCWPESGPDRKCYPGPQVTWTLSSVHIQRLAVDVHAIEGTYAQFEEVAHLFGIDRPDALVAKGDYGHFEFGGVLPPSPPALPYRVQLKNTLKALARFVTGTRHNALTRKKERLEEFIEEEEAGVD